MKHIFAYVDKLITVLKFVPASLKTDEDMYKARKSINLIREYTRILSNLIDGHKTEWHLKKLHEAHINDVKNWSEHVTKVFINLDYFLSELDKDTKLLTDILDSNESQIQKSQRWFKAIPDMSMAMVMSGLHDDEEEMKKLRNVATFEIHELEKIIKDKKHLEGLHLWGIFAKLSEEEQLVEHEKYFMSLL